MANIDLKEIETFPSRFGKWDKDKIKKENEKLNAKIIEYQKQMYAQGEYSLLVVMQGMDASGKWWAVRKTFMGINPAGAQVTSFKVPSKEERAHDFLWRIHKKAPKRGMISVFDRSHYEDLLVPLVEDFLSEKQIAERAEHINNFEKMMEDNKTIVLKFYLHVSHEEQKRRLHERLTNPLKYWKHEDGDFRKSSKYEKFIDAYHWVFEQTDTKTAPRHIIQSDNNHVKINQISQVIVKAFEEEMKLEWPDLETDFTLVEVPGLMEE